MKGSRNMSKTIAVKTVIARINHMLEHSTPEMRDGRVALTVLAETLLHETKNYHGFGYLPSEYATDGEPVAEGTSCLRVGYDDTRRQYYNV